MSYALTPKIGLYKPTIDADDNLWGGHLNQNADTLDAAVGSVANVLNFGAQQNTGFDSTAAFRAALATGRSVYFPGGPYKINDKLVVGNNQTFYGDNRNVSVLFVDAATFNLAATAVIELGSFEQGARAHDFQIQFFQPDTAVRANVVHFPPAIAMNGGRFQIARVRISGGAWIGLDATLASGADPGNAACQINDFECCALGKGIIFNGTKDWASIVNFHFWGFGLGPYPGLSAVLRDGQTVAAEFGNVDGVDAHGFKVLAGIVHFTTAASDGWFSFSNFALDSNGSQMIVDGAQWLQISNFYSARNSALSQAITVNAGYVYISNPNIQGGGATLTDIKVTGGELNIHGGYNLRLNTATSAAEVTGGFLRMHGHVTHAGADSAWTVPMIKQSGSGILLLDNCTVSGGTSSGVAVQCTNDVSSVHNMVLGAGWTMALLAGNYRSQFGGNYGTQLVIGKLAQGGRLDFARGTDGLSRAWIGMTGANSTVLGLANTTGSPFVVIDAQNASGTVSLRTNSVERLSVTDTAVTVTQPLVIGASGPTIRSGAGAATGTQPKGSQWIRTDGAVGSTLYVSQGGGTWNAVAGV